MIGYKDRTYCGSDVEVHTCGREFTEQDAKDAEKWWGGKDYPVAYMNFCDEETNDGSNPYWDNIIEKLGESDEPAPINDPYGILDEHDKFVKSLKGVNQ